MSSKNVYLTFPTDPETAFLLKKIANGMGMTQPELINELCKGFIEDLANIAKEKLDAEAEE